MKVVKCQNGHFFDYEKYVLCPHCKAEVETANSSKNETQKSAKHWLFGGKKTDAGKETAHPIPSQPMTKSKDTEMYSTETIPQTEYISQSESIPEEPTAASASNTGDGPTFDIWRDKPDVPKVKTPDEQLKEMNVVQPVQITEGETLKTVAHPEDSISVPPASTTADSTGATAEASSLLNEIKRVSTAEEGRTIGFFSPASVQKSQVMDEPKAQCFDSCAGPVDPVVGWLVCCSGGLLGRSYVIVAGKNSIGRSDSNKIVIEDLTVSREKHAWISYEPKKRVFYIQPGESSGLTYLNDENVMVPQQLKNRDIIEMGNSKFLFVPLCDESFSWEEYLK